VQQLAGRQGAPPARRLKGGAAYAFTEIATLKAEPVVNEKARSSLLFRYSLH